MKVRYTTVQYLMLYCTGTLMLTVCYVLLTGDLHFAYARRSDELADNKVYKCVVFNPHLDLRAGGSYTRITVRPTGTVDLTHYRQLRHHDACSR